MRRSDGMNVTEVSGSWSSGEDNDEPTIYRHTSKPSGGVSTKSEGNLKAGYLFMPNDSKDPPSPAKPFRVPHRRNNDERRSLTTTTSTNSTTDLENPRPRSNVRSSTNLSRKGKTGAYSDNKPLLKNDDPFINPSRVRGGPSSTANPHEPSDYGASEPSRRLPGNSPTRQPTHHRMSSSIGKASPLGHSRLNSGNTTSKQVGESAGTRAPRQICVCGASAFYERERFSILKEKNRLREEASRLKEHHRNLSADQKALSAESVQIEHHRAEVDKSWRAAEDIMAAVKEDRAANEHMKRGLARQKEQIDRTREGLERELFSFQAKKDELDRMTTQTEKLHCELMSRKTELDERVMQFKKNNVRFENQQTRLNQENEELTKLRGELEKESRRIAEEKDNLYQQEQALEERRRSLMGRENTLNEELAALEDQRADAEKRTQEVSEREVKAAKKQEQVQDYILKKETELNKQCREMELEKQKFERIKNDFAMEQRQLRDSVAAEREQQKRQFTIEREDFESQLRLEREWVQSEKENIEKFKDASRQELEAERQHAQDVLKQLRTQNADQIEKERLAWKEQEQQMMEACRKRVAEIDKMREDIAARENRLNQQQQQLSEAKRKFLSEKDKFSERLDNEEERLAAIKLQLQQEQKVLGEKTAGVCEAEQALEESQRKIDKMQMDMVEGKRFWKARREAIEEEAKSVRERSRRIAQKESELKKREGDLVEREAILAERETRLSGAEARARWIQDVFKEVKENKSQLQAEKEQLEWEKKRIDEGRKLLETREKRLEYRITSMRSDEHGVYTPTGRTQLKGATPKENQPRKPLPPLHVDMASLRLRQAAQASPCYKAPDAAPARPQEVTTQMREDLGSKGNGSEKSSATEIMAGDREAISAEGPNGSGDWERSELEFEQCSDESRSFAYNERIPFDEHVDLNFSMEKSDIAPNPGPWKSDHTAKMLSADAGDLSQECMSSPLVGDIESPQASEEGNGEGSIVGGIDYFSKQLSELSYPDLKNGEGAANDNEEGIVEEEIQDDSKKDSSSQPNTSNPSRLQTDRTLYLGEVKMELRGPSSRGTLSSRSSIAAPGKGQKRPSNLSTQRSSVDVVEDKENLRSENEFRSKKFPDTWETNIQQHHQAQVAAAGSKAAKYMSPFHEPM